MNNTTKDNIADYIHNEFGLSKKDCNEIVINLIEYIILGLQKDKIVKIHNFGTFKLKHKNSRIGRNPKNNVEFTITSRNVISFTASKKFMVFINDIKN